MASKTGFLGIRLTEEEEKQIQKLINTGKAKDRRQAYEILTVAKYMASQEDEENNPNENKEEEDNKPESIPVKKPEESTAKILMDLYKDNKKLLTSKNGKDGLIEQLGYTYLNNLLQENQALRQEIYELNERIKKLENEHNVWSVIENHWDDIMTVINNLKNNNTPVTQENLVKNADKIKKITEKVERL